MSGSLDPRAVSTAAFGDILVVMRPVLLTFVGLALVACSSDGGRGSTTGVTGSVPTGSTDSPTGGTAEGSTAVATSATSEAMTSSEGDTTSTVGDPDTSAGSFPDVAQGETETTGGEACVPVSDVEQTCDDIDDDCNGLVDDVDEGGDGICDCLAIAIVGTSGGLAASEFQQWLIDRGSTAERIDPAVVDATVLDAYDVVILDQLTRTYTPAEAMAFDTWVGGGGGLMSMTGHTASEVSAQQWPNSILGLMGLRYQGALLDGPVTDFELHPISTGLTSVTFLGGFEVVADNPAVVDVVGRLPGGVPAGIAAERGEGKVFVWGDEWIEYDSEWVALPEITQLWVNIFEWITPMALCNPPPG